MENKLIKEMVIPSGNCEYSGRLGFSGCAYLFIDAAGEHADKLGIGMRKQAEQSRFWTVYKTRIDFFGRPGMSEPVTLETWPEKPTMFMGLRDYRLKSGERTVACGKTQWVVVDTTTGRPVIMKDIFPAGFEYCEEHVIDEPFERFTGEIPEQVLGKYTVKSIDIDVGHHMNNVAYIRAIESLFSTRELRMMDLKSFEIHYQKSCFEGDEIEFRVEEEDKRIKLYALCKNEVIANILLRY